MDTPKITTEDRLHCVFCHRPMSETAFLRRKVARFQVFAKLTAKGILGSSPFNPGIVAV